jgi:MYXO-CTERM domain-containing protein
MRLVPLATTALASIFYAANAGAATNVACVGDSITYGYGLNANESYPSNLQGRLGAGYVVKNFGQNGATMLKKGDNPYWKLAIFTQSDMFAPNIVVIMLGTNDSKPGNWVYESEFEGDYAEMIKHYRDLGAKVYVAIPPPAVNNPAFWQVDKVIPHIRKVAADTAAPTIDVNAAFVGKPQLFADDVHPNAAGAKVLADTVFAGITQMTDGGMIVVDAAKGYDAASGAGGATGAGGRAGAGGAGGAGRADAGNSAAGSSGSGNGGGGLGAAGATTTSAGGTAGGGGIAVAAGTGGDDGAAPSDAAGDAGCSCRTASRAPSPGLWAAALLLFMARRVENRPMRRRLAPQRPSAPRDTRALR